MDDAEDCTAVSPSTGAGAVRYRVICCYHGVVGRSIWYVVDLVGFGGLPTDSSTYHSMAWCAGMLSGNLVTCPNMALQPLVIRSDTGARPVRKETAELRTKSCAIQICLLLLLFF